MLGWHVSVYRQQDGGTSPATAQSPQGTRLAVWQTGWRGIEWIDDLVKNGKAIDLGGSGYPCRYTAIAEHLLPQLVDSPPQANAVWSSSPGDILTERWEGRTIINDGTIQQCRADEWLFVEAWDES